MDVKNSLQQLSGVQFEQLCQELLQRMEFSVKTTTVTGDGGIDLLAFNSKPMLKGKYIIQCKRYIGSVGVSMVRDLYGVVTDERANKGILITTGKFTASAIDFASDKNLELIDGDVLIKLLDEYHLIKQDIPQYTIHFRNHPAFDSEKYNFYRNMISQNKCTAEIGRDFLFTFLASYMTGKNENSHSDNIQIMHCGLAKEYIELFDWYVNRYHRRGKEQQEVLPFYVRHYRGLAQLYNFDLFDYVQARYDILTNPNTIKIASNVDGIGFRLFSLSNIPKDFKNATFENRFNAKKVQFFPGYEYYELLNLISIFRFFDIPEGIDKINRILYGLTPEYKTWIESQTSYKMTLAGCFIYIPKISIRHTSKGNSKPVFDRISVEYKERITLLPYYLKYREQFSEKISQEKKQILALLNTL